MGVFHCFIQRIAFLALCLYGFSLQDVNAQGVENSHLNEPCGFATVIDQLEVQYPGFKLKFDAQTVKLLKSEPIIESRKSALPIPFFITIPFTQSPLFFTCCIMWPMKT